jgi:hypothetical protein
MEEGLLHERMSCILLDTIRRRGHAMQILVTEVLCRTVLRLHVLQKALLLPATLVQPWGRVLQEYNANAQLDCCMRAQFRCMSDTAAKAVLAGLSFAHCYFCTVQDALMQPVACGLDSVHDVRRDIFAPAPSHVVRKVSSAP